MTSPPPPLDPVLLGAALALWLARGGAEASLSRHGLVVHTGERAVRVRFSVRP